MAGVGVTIFLSPAIGETVSILWWVHDTMLQYHNNIMSCHYTNEMEICMSCSCCITYKHKLTFHWLWILKQHLGLFFSFTHLEDYLLLSVFCVVMTEMDIYCVEWNRSIAIVEIVDGVSNWPFKLTFQNNYRSSGISGNHLGSSGHLQGSSGHAGQVRTPVNWIL